MLKGISLPSLDQVAGDALAVLSASPVSVSPDGQLAVIDVLYTNGSAQLHAFLLADLIDGSYSTNYNSVIGLGDATSVKTYAAAVIWTGDNVPTLSISYEDLADAGSSGLYNRIGIVADATRTSADLIESASNVIADGSISKVASDDTGRYIAFETAATNLSPIGSLDTNTITDVYLIDTVLGTLTRVSALDDGTEAFDESKLQDVEIIDGKSSVIFSTEAAEVFSARDTNVEQDLYLWRDDSIQLVSSNFDGEAAGYDGGIASFFGDDIGFLATDLVETDVDGLIDLYLVNTDSLSKRVDTVTDSLTFAADYDLWIEGGQGASIILGSNGVSQGTTDISNQLLQISINEGSSKLLSLSSNGTLADDISFAPAVSEISNTTIFQTSATNLVASLDSLAFVVNHSNTLPEGELEVTGPVRVGQTVSIDVTSFEDPDGYGMGLSYTWFIDDEAQIGETGNSFTLTNPMEGKDLSVSVSYSDNWGVAETISLNSAVEIGSKGVQIALGGKTLSHGAIVANIDGNSTQISSTSSYFDLQGSMISAVSLADDMHTSDIGISDAIASLRHIVGLSTLTGKAALAADVNNDSAIGISDVIAQLRHIVGLTKIDSFDVVTADGKEVGTTLQNQTSVELILNGDVNLSTELQPAFYDI